MSENISISMGFFWVGLAYLCGSLSFAVLVSRMMGLADPRSYGSQNPGATNVLRSGNRIAAALTLLLDLIKGWLPVVIFKAIWGVEAQGWLAVVALAAFLGHLYPVFFQFKGGKGVATALGVLLALQPWLGVATLLSWLIVAGFTRYSSLAALVAAVFAPTYYGLGGISGFWQTNGWVGSSVLLMALWLIWRHRLNIQRLFHGQETQMGQKDPSKKS